MRFSFIHAADLHLDSIFKGISSKAVHLEELFKKAAGKAQENLVDLAIDKGVDFVLLAGDLFDWKEQSIQAQLLFARNMRRLERAGISVFLVAGNHDPYDKLELAVELPENVKMFGPDRPETHLVTRDGNVLCCISGISHKRPREKRNLASLLSGLPCDHFHIGLLHANVGHTGHDNYAPCSLSELKKSTVDYWALGHVHNRAILSESPHVVYPGNIQGLNPNETGKKGCFLVTVDSVAKEIISMEFQPLDSLRWHILEYDIEGEDALDELEEGLKRELVALEQTQNTESAPLAHICRILLHGRSRLFWQLQRDGALEEIRETLNELLLDSGSGVWIAKIRESVKPPVDLCARRKRDDLLGEVLRSAHLLRKDREKLKEEVERCLSPLAANRKLRKLLDELPADFNQMLVEDVEGLLINLLEGD